MDKRKKNTGLRARFRELLDPSRATWPRRSKKLRSGAGAGTNRPTLCHPVSWYTDGHLVNRPMNGVYAMAVFAEWCLSKVKAGYGGDLCEATAFYADTRRFMDTILHNRKAGRNLTAKQREEMRPRVRRLVEQARNVSSKFKR